MLMKLNLVDSSCHLQTHCLREGFLDLVAAIGKMKCQLQLQILQIVASTECYFDYQRDHLVMFIAVHQINLPMAILKTDYFAQPSLEHYLRTNLPL